MTVSLRGLAIVVGPVAALSVLFLVPEHYTAGDGAAMVLPLTARIVLAVAAWMAIWWLTEAVPLPVTAWLPLTFFPLAGVDTFKNVAAAYAHPLIFLFLGGFLLSIALQKWGLHRRFAVTLIQLSGADRSRLVAGFMLGTALLSMWISNTASTVMMLPMALSVLGDERRDDNFGKCLLLGVAYGASIGGMATLIGTPPNVFVASYLSDVVGVPIDFVTWMAFGVPVAAVLLPVTWLLLTRMIFPLGAAAPVVTSLAAADGIHWRALGRPARAVLVIFAATVFAWMARPWLTAISISGWQPLAGLSDPGIAMLAACLLFVWPGERRGGARLLVWGDTDKLPWGTLMLFGGGLSLAGAVNHTGVDGYIGSFMYGLPALPGFGILLIMVTLVVFLTELTSNIATTATLVPVLAASVGAFGLDTATVCILTALAASCAFMLPVATPPNAIVFGSGRIHAQDMARAGFVINLCGIATIGLIAIQIIPLALGAR